MQNREGLNKRVRLSPPCFNPPRVPCCSYNEIYIANSLCLICFQPTSPPIAPWILSSPPTCTHTGFLQRDHAFLLTVLSGEQLQIFKWPPSSFQYSDLNSSSTSQRLPPPLITPAQRDQPQSKSHCLVLLPIQHSYVQENHMLVKNILYSLSSTLEGKLHGDGRKIWPVFTAESLGSNLNRTQHRVGII
jgi:hypothetical protein